MLTEKYPQLIDLFHPLDIWHKAKKLTKALHQVSNVLCSALCTKYHKKGLIKFLGLATLRWGGNVGSNPVTKTS